MLAWGALGLVIPALLILRWKLTGASFGEVESILWPSSILTMGLEGPSPRSGLEIVEVYAALDVYKRQVNYQTNNFLGLGETLSVQANLGSISRTFQFGFTQPYIRNRPINVGFQVFNQKQDYNAAKNYQATTGADLNLSNAQKSLTQNYNVGSDGFNFSVSYPLKRHAFQRVGVTYSLTKSTITAFSTASSTFFQTIAFRSGIQGSNPLAGIINSNLGLSYSYNTVSNPLRPHDGKEYTAFLQIAGLWGDVRYINPAVAYKRYIPMHYLVPTVGGRNVLAVRAQLNYIQGISGDVAPPNNRFYSGGEMDMRGFDVRSTTPDVYKRQGQSTS